MGKNARPEREEQEFLFGLFLRGYSDADVLAKYLELEDERKLNFPVRTDRRTIRQMRGEFEAARAVLEPYLRRQLDPAFEKAREEHLGGVRARLERWRKGIYVPGMETVEPRHYELIPDSFGDEREAPWFKSLSEHLPRTKHGSLWGSYDRWQSQYVEYLTLHRALRHQILEDGKTRFEPRGEEAKEKRLLAEESYDPDSADLWHAIVRVEDPIMPDAEHHFTTPFFEAFAGTSLGKKLEFSFYSRGGYEIPYRRPGPVGLDVMSVEVRVAESVSDVYMAQYEAMVREYLNAKEVGGLLGAFRRLRELSSGISLSVDTILERRDYITSMCSLCPGQGMV